MKLIPFVILLVLWQPCCTMAQMKKTDTTSKSKPNVSTPIKAIDGFMSWYSDNYLNILNYKMIYTDSAGNYRVNIKDCTGYFSSLISSGYISQEYVRLWSDYCVSQDEKFIISPQNEGPPEGFDMDLVLLSQETAEVLKIYKNFKYSTVKTDKSSAIIMADTGWPDWIYVFELSKIKDRWYIDYISIKEPD